MTTTILMMMMMKKKMMMKMTMMAMTTMMMVAMMMSSSLPTYYSIFSPLCIEEHLGQGHSVCFHEGIFGRPWNQMIHQPKQLVRRQEWHSVMAKNIAIRHFQQQESTIKKDDFISKGTWCTNGTSATPQTLSNISPIRIHRWLFLLSVREVII